jgi:hypothetical protein
MSGGGLMQLVAYGAQDVYLTANPQVTFFKQLYRRHSNFSMEAIEQTFNGVANFGKRVTCTIARNGDLISKVYLQATLPQVAETDLVAGVTKFSWIPFVGQYLIKQVELEIGGQLIDRQYGDWLHIWNELTMPAGKNLNYLRMVNGLGGMILSPGNGNCGDGCADTEKNCGIHAVLARMNSTGTDSISCGHLTGSYWNVDDCLVEKTVYIPLEFWFNRHYGLALPLIALQYHEVKINLDFNELKYLVNIEGSDSARSTMLSRLNSKGLVSASLFVDYIYLDTEERRRFAQVAHEYLIEQVQFTGEESVTSSANKIKLDFNHPVKELIWVIQNPSFVDCAGSKQEPYRYSTADLNGNPTAVAKIQLNGHDRFSEREGSYFNYVQTYQHHSASPSTGINVYSFATRPEDHQPSGSCNFSRIDNAVLNLTLSSDAFSDGDGGIVGSNSVRVYAVNYNVLRIMSGMGGLAFSN